MTDDAIEIAPEFNDGVVAVEFGAGRVCLHGTAEQRKRFWAALLESQRAVRDQAHDSQATGGERGGAFRYTSAEAVIGEARRAFNAAGLVHLPTGHLVAHGGERYEIETLHLLHDTVGGATMEIRSTRPVLHHRGMKVDKATCAALTNDIHYTARALLLMARPDEAVPPLEDRDDASIEPNGAGRQKPPHQAKKLAEAAERIQRLQAQVVKDGQALGCESYEQVFKLDEVVRLTRGARPKTERQWQEVAGLVSEIRLRRESAGNPWDKAGPWQGSGDDGQSGPTDHDGGASAS